MGWRLSHALIYSLICSHGSLKFADRIAGFALALCCASWRYRPMHHRSTHTHTHTHYSTSFCKVLPFSAFLERPVKALLKIVSPFLLRYLRSFSTMVMSWRNEQVRSCTAKSELRVNCSSCEGGGGRGSTRRVVEWQSRVEEMNERALALFLVNWVCWKRRRERKRTF